MTPGEKIQYFEQQQSQPLKEIWKGRNTDSSLGPQYYHQAIDLEPSSSTSKTGKSVGIIGYSCDAGVARNLGRGGARVAPNAIRSRLAKVAWHAENVSIGDYGNITCVGDQLEDCQERFSDEIAKLIQHDIFPMAIGGGHDIAAAHFNGLWKAKSQNENPKIGIINFDAHFDLRPVVANANSGTPFNQILSAHTDQVKYMPIGIQQSANTKSLFDIAENFGVSYLLAESCEEQNLQNIFNQIDKYLSESDYIYISIDMDGFSSAYAPGVSAPSPFGLTPNFVVKCLGHIFKSHKVISCDLAECNPLYDLDNRTTTLAARLIDRIIKLV